METKEMIERLENIVNITKEITDLKKMMIRNCERVEKKFAENGTLTAEYSMKFIKAQLGIIDTWAEKVKEIKNISNNVEEYFPGKWTTNVFIVSECKKIIEFKDDYSKIIAVVMEQAELDAIKDILGKMREF